MKINWSALNYHLAELVKLLFVNLLIMASHTEECKLSKNDAAVLEYLFNPLMQSPGQAEVYMVENAEVSSEGDTEGLTEDILQQVKQLEVDGVYAARLNDFTTALTCLTKAIELAPSYSSPYNNRAQVKRLMREYESAHEDLTIAISISDPDSSSPVNLRVAKLAYAQRGFLLKGFLDKNEEGQKDLLRASQLGHSLASLETNPFRTLCGEMVSIMMKEQCGIDV